MYAPFDPCGALMDFLRFPFQTSMRIVAGQAGVPARWYALGPGHRVKPSGVGWGSRIWEEEWRRKADDGSFGEVFGIRPEWLPRVPGDHPPCDKGPYWPEQFRPGVSVKDADTYPVLARDGQGWPIACCEGVETVNLHPACSLSVVKRLPDRIWLKFSPTPVNTCWNETTIIQLDWDEGGSKWFGIGDPGFRGLYMEVTYAVDSLSGGCLINFDITVPGLPSGQGIILAMGLVIGPVAIFPTDQRVNPPYMRWLRTAGLGFNSVILCNFPEPMRNFDIELFASDPS